MAKRTQRNGAHIRMGVVAFFYGLMILFCSILTFEITRQVWFTLPANDVTPSCRAGLVTLLRGLDAARVAAHSKDDSSPEEAVARFCKGLLPHWDTRDAVATSCQGEKKSWEAFRLIERLRDAEESAVRRDGRDLSPLRQHVRALRVGSLSD